MTDHLAELKKLLGTDKITLGTDQAFKLARQGAVEKVFVSSNAPAQVKEDLVHFSQVGGFEVVDLGIPNYELGTVCRKPFSVSLISVRK